MDLVRDTARLRMLRKDGCSPVRWTGDVVPPRNTGNSLASKADFAQDRKLLLFRPASPALHPRHQLIAHAIPAAFVADVYNDGHYTSAHALRKAVQSRSCIKIEAGPPHRGRLVQRSRQTINSRTDLTSVIVRTSSDARKSCSRGKATEAQFSYFSITSCQPAFAPG